MTPTTAEIARLQSYMRENARGQYEAVALPPFTIFFHPTDRAKWFNYAIPDGAVGGVPEDYHLREVLARLRAEFHARSRQARFEFFEAFAPDLPAALRDCGFTEEARQWSMVCMPASLCRPPEVPGLEVTAVHPDSPDADVYDFILAQHQGFNPADTTSPTAADVEQSRESFAAGGWRAFLGRIDGQAAGVSVFGRPIDGVSEIAGVATREAFRRRGIAALLSWHAAQAAFTAGVEIACLTAEDERAGRVYERLGFQPFSTMLAYIE